MYLTLLHYQVRHTYDETITGELLGHTHSKITFGVYAIAHKCHTLSEAISKLKLDIDLGKFVKPYTVGCFPLARAARKLRRDAGDPFLHLSPTTLANAVALNNRPRRQITTKHPTKKSNSPDSPRRRKNI